MFQYHCVLFKKYSLYQPVNEREIEVSSVLFKALSSKKLTDLKCKQAVEIIGFIQQNSEAAASRKYSLDEAVGHIQLLVLILVTCHRAV